MWMVYHCHSLQKIQNKALKVINSRFYKHVIRSTVEKRVTELRAIRHGGGVLYTLTQLFSLEAPPPKPDRRMVRTRLPLTGNNVRTRRKPHVRLLRP